MDRKNASGQDNFKTGIQRTAFSLLMALAMAIPVWSSHAAAPDTVNVQINARLASQGSAEIGVPFGNDRELAHRLARQFKAIRIDYADGIAWFDVDPGELAAIRSVARLGNMSLLHRSDIREKAARVIKNRDKAEQKRNLALEMLRAKNLPTEGSTPSHWRVRQLDATGRPDIDMDLNADAAFSTRADLVRNTSPYNVDGSGWLVGEWEVGGIPRTTHDELNGSIVVQDAVGTSDHATHVAGTLVGQGVVAQALGMAPGANIHAYDHTNDSSEMDTAGATAGNQSASNIYISNHSYGTVAGWVDANYSGVSGPHWVGVWGEPEDRSFGQYNSSASSWDQVVYDNPWFLPFKSAGNDRNDAPPSNGTTFYYWNSGWQSAIYNSAFHPDIDGDAGGYDSVTTYGNAKNIMTVGAVNDVTNQTNPNPAMSSFSGWGPADDGRIKPDIVANGVGLYSSLSSSDSSYGSYNGTSMSSPNAAGSALLLQDYYDDEFSTAMRASTLKALIIHTADDLGNTGPDYVYGWGLMDTEAAADKIAQQAAEPGVLHILNQDLANSATDSFTVAPLDPGQPIRVTLVWTDPAAPALSGYDDRTAVLINDLDLRIDDGSTTFMPWVLDVNNPSNAATTGDNTVDNVEQVIVSSPVSGGSYTISVTHKGALGLAQNYSLIFSNVIQGLTVNNPGTQSNTTGDTVSLQINAIDPENDPLTYSATGLPNGLGINTTTGLISGTINAAPATYSVTVTATDGSDSDSTTFDWIVLPVYICSHEENFDDGTSDWANDGTSTCSTGSFIISTPTEWSQSGVTTQPAGDHTSGSGQAFYTATNIAVGTNDVDGGECSAQSGTYSVSQDSELSIWYFHGQRDSGSNPTDDYFRLEYTLDSGSSWTPLASVGDTSTNAVWAQATASITAGSNVRLRVVASDGPLNGDIVEAGVDDFSICYEQPFNTAPAVDPVADQLDYEGDTVSVQVTASDDPGDTLTYSATGLPPTLSINSSTGEITGTIPASSVAVYAVTVTVSDGTLNTSVDFSWSVVHAAASNDLIYISSTSTGDVGFNFRDRDIVTYNTATGTWAMYFDGSDVGLSSYRHDIDAFTILSDGSIIFSILRPETLPDVGSIDDSDLIRFIPTSTGDVTAGSFELYFDGSDVGLTTDNENIDAVHLLANGDLLISTIGPVDTGSVTGLDEDLIRFTPATLGNTTSGAWARYFDGSDVDLGAVKTEDVTGTWVNEATGDIYLTTLNRYVVPGITGRGDEIFICTPGSIGSTTTCTYTPYFNGEIQGLGFEQIDGIHIEP